MSHDRALRWVRGSGDVKIDTEKCERLIHLVQAGADADLAAESIGLTPEQFDGWKSDLDFLRQLDSAMTTARMLAQIKLKNQAPGTWLNKNHRTSARRPREPKVVQPKEPLKLPKLNARQLKFAHKYAETGNGALSAVYAGYGKSRAKQTAHDLVTNRDVAAAIEALRRDDLLLTDANRERWLREVASQSFFDPAQVFDADGGLLPIHSIPKEARLCIAGLEVEELYDYVQGEGRTTKGVVRKVRFRDKAPFVNMLGKFLKVLTDRVEHTGKDGGALTLEFVREAFERSQAREKANGGTNP